MASRKELHSKLVEILGSTNVYYQPPANISMKYPAIRYKKNRIGAEHANNKAYIKNIEYEIIVISQTPDHPSINKILDLGYCRHSRTYVADNLYHDVLMINY